MDCVSDRISMKETYNFHKADSSYGETNPMALGLDARKLNTFPGMSLEEHFEVTAEESNRSAFTPKNAVDR